MQIRNVGSNMTELSTSGATVLFSYSTPVAAFVLGRVDDINHREARYIRTEQFHSATTSKHINKWLRDKGLDPDKVRKVPQMELDYLIR